MIESGYYAFNTHSTAAQHSNDLEAAKTLSDALVKQVKAIDVVLVHQQIHEALAVNDADTLARINNTLPSNQLITKMKDLGYSKEDELLPPARNGLEHLGYDNRIYFAAMETVWENPNLDSSTFTLTAFRAGDAVVKGGAQLEATEKQLQRMKAMMPAKVTDEHLYFRDGRVYDRKTGELLNGTEDKRTWQERLDDQLAKEPSFSVDFSNLNWRKDTMLNDLLEQKMTLEEIERAQPFHDKEVIAAQWQSWKDAYELAKIYWQKLLDYGIANEDGTLTQPGVQKTEFSLGRFDVLLDVKV